jgi:hypothetical protein
MSVQGLVPHATVGDGAGGGIAQCISKHQFAQAQRGRPEVAPEWWAMARHYHLVSQLAC